MRIYEVEPGPTAWTVVCAGRAILAQDSERLARRAAEVLNTWALVEAALHLDQTGRPSSRFPRFTELTG